MDSVRPDHDAHATEAAPGAAAGKPKINRVLVFTIIALALMMMAIDGTIVATALDALQHGLHTSINWAGWTITAYSFGFVLMLPLSGKLAEQYGRRRVFLCSVVAFTVTSLLCGLVSNIFLLIALRALQAAGGAGFTPSATGIIVDYFGRERDRAVSLLGSTFPVGGMIGPIFGGLFVTYWTWRGIFLVNVPFGIAVIALSLRYIPRDPPRKERTRAKADPMGMALLGIGILTAMFAITWLGEPGASLVSPLFLGPCVVAIAALWGFFHHIAHREAPFIPPNLIHGPGFGVVNLINGLLGGIPFGTISLIPIYAINRYGISALDSGTLLIAQGAASVAFSVWAALIIRRSGYRMPMYVGSAVAIIGIVLLAVGPHFGLSAYLWLAGSAFLVGAGTGGLNPASRNAGLQLAPERASVLAALRSMCMSTGSITTISVATAFIASSANPGGTQAWFYFGAAVVVVLSLPLVARVPEHRGAW